MSSFSEERFTTKEIETCFLTIDANGNGAHSVIVVVVGSSFVLIRTYCLSRSLCFVHSCATFPLAPQFSSSPSLSPLTSPPHLPSTPHLILLRGPSGTVELDEFLFFMELCRRLVAGSYYRPSMMIVRPNIVHRELFNEPKVSGREYTVATSYCFLLLPVASCCSQCLLLLVVVRRSKHT